MSHHKCCCTRLGTYNVFRYVSSVIAHFIFTNTSPAAMQRYFRPWTFRVRNLFTAAYCIRWSILKFNSPGGADMDDDAGAQLYCIVFSIIFSPCYVQFNNHYRKVWNMFYLSVSLNQCAIRHTTITKCIYLVIPAFLQCLICQQIYIIYLKMYL